MLARDFLLVTIIAQQLETEFRDGETLFLEIWHLEIYLHNIAARVSVAIVLAGVVHIQGVIAAMWHWCW